jgi:RNA polymerase sigma-70 factor (ECF subfamily)
MQEVVVEVQTLGGIEDVYREHAAKLWRSLVAFTGDPEIASDAVAEAFAQVIARGHAVRDPGRWVWRVAYLVAAGHLRDRDVTGFDAVPWVDPSNAAERDADLMTALAQLPQRQRAAIVLHYLVDLPTREIATTLQVSPTTVRVLLLQGRRRLREVLGGSDGRTA